MVTFANTVTPTPFGIFDADTAFQTEADNMVLFVRRMLGDDVVSVALPKRTIWAAFEEATLQYSELVNEYQFKSQIHLLKGQPTGSNVQNQYPRESVDHLIRQAEPYAMEAGYSGYKQHVSGSIDLVSRQQDYNLLTDLKNGDGTALFQTQTTGSFGKMRIMEVFHFSPLAAYRFFDSTSAINYLNNEFSFESFTPETIFYVLPVFEDLLRAGQMQLSQRVRRSNYSYDIRGSSIRIYPMPTFIEGQTKKLWIRVMLPPDPFNPSYTDDTIDGISNISDVPFGNLTYTEITSMGRNWIRKYTLSLCMETLGYIRGKFNTIPIPGGEVTLNYGDLLSSGRDDKDKLITTLRETLDQLTDQSIVEIQATKAENLLKQLRLLPMPNGYFIKPG